MGGGVCSQKAEEECKKEKAEGTKSYIGVLSDQTRFFGAYATIEGKSVSVESVHIAKVSFFPTLRISFFTCRGKLF